LRHFLSRFNWIAFPTQLKAYKRWSRGMCFTSGRILVVSCQIEMTKLECEVVKSRVQVYCSPKLAEHAARHTRRNVVQNVVPHCPSIPSPSHWRRPRVRGGPSRRPPTRFGAEPDLLPLACVVDYWSTCFISINRFVEDASLSRSKSGPGLST